MQEERSTMNIRRNQILLGLLALCIAVSCFTLSSRILPANRGELQAETTESIYTEPEETVIPYIQEEVDRVVQRVQSVQQPGSFTFFAVTDTHESPANTAANQQVGIATALIRDAVAIDFATLLGDITSGTETTTLEDGVNEILAVNSYLEKAYSGIPNFRTPGNHDPLTYSYEQNGDYLSNEELFDLIGAYNEGAVYGSTSSSYCYRDLEEFKLRVILLNTSETNAFSKKPRNTGCFYMSGEQMKWFAEAMDLSDRSDAGLWGIMLLSHTPLDYDTIQKGTGKILDAYLNGTSTEFTWEGVDISYDYAGRNAPEIIANIYGHEHYPYAGNLYLTSQDGCRYRSFLLRICIPNASLNRNVKLETDVLSEGENSQVYLKKSGSAQETAFNVITVNRRTRRIHCTNYGAGYDRTFTYDTRIQAPSGTYENLIPSAQIMNSTQTTPLEGIGYKNGAYLSSSNFCKIDPDHVLTGAIPYQVPRKGLPPTLYVWGADVTDSERVRFFMFNNSKSWAFLSVKGYEINYYFQIEELGKHYYKLTPIASGDSSVLREECSGIDYKTFIAWSFEGYGKEIVVTFDEPILK